MAIFKFSNAGGFGAFTRYNDFLAGNPSFNPDAGSMFPIGAFVIPSGQTTLTIDNIPQTYQHLQIRGIVRSSRAVTQNYVNFRFNNNATAGNYRGHLLYGNGSAIRGDFWGETDRGMIEVAAASGLASSFTAFVMDILDYTNTSKLKTVRILSGYDFNGSGAFSLGSTWFNSTSTITRIDFSENNAFNILANSSFALYGIKG